MRFHTLTMEGIGPFAGSEHIDFDAVGGEGIFLLRGETGSGKSSVLNSITYALYGTLKDQNPEIVSHHKALALVPKVILEFTVGSVRYRVERTPAWNRPKARGQGTTTERTSGALFRRVDGAWQEISANQQEIGKELTGILGLTREQFTQVMLLQQGRFAAFLTATEQERRAVLTQIFSAGPYERIQAKLKEQAEEANGQLQGEQIRLETALQTLAQLEIQLREALSGAEETAGGDRPTEPAQTSGFDLESREERAALADLARRESQRLSSAERAAAGERRAVERTAEALRGDRAILLTMERLLETARTAESRREMVMSSRTRLALHEKSAVPLSLARTAEQARERLEALEQRAGEAERELIEHEAEAPRWLNGDVLQEEHSLTEHSAGRMWLRDAAQLSAHLRTSSALERRLQEKSQALEAAAGRRVAAELTRAAALEGAEAAAAARASHAGSPELVAETLRGVEEAKALLTRVVDIERAEEQTLAAEAAYADALAAEAEATRALAELRRVYAQQVAPRLAAQLVEGEPCLVCGSAEHPDPAADSGSAPLVTDEQTEAAAQSLSEASTQASEAKSALSLARQRVELLTIAGERPARAEAESGLAEAERKAEAAKADADRAVELAQAEAAALTALRSREQALQKEEIALAATAQSRAEAEESLSAHRLEAVRLSAALGLPGEEPEGELAAGTAFLTEREALGQKKAELSQLAAQARQARDDAESHLSAALESQGFLTLAEAEAASLTGEELAEHETAWAEAQERSHGLRQGSHSLREAPGGVLVDDGLLENAAAVFSAAAEVTECGISLARLAERILWVKAAASHAGLALRIAASRVESEEAAVRRQSVLVSSFERQIRGSLAEADAILERLGGALEKAELLSRLAETAAGNGPDNQRRMSLQTYVLASRLEEIAAAASERLAPMTSGRYLIFHDDQKVGHQKAGLGLRILDTWTNQYRPPSSLSGGEAFMASLSLALGLADVVQAEAGGIRLDTLFVDEGFGTLDAQTLETVMEVLDALREGGRTVGIVSHVTELHERIPRQVVVTKTKTGSTLSLSGV